MINTSTDDTISQVNIYLVKTMITNFVLQEKLRVLALGLSLDP